MLMDASGSERAPAGADRHLPVSRIVIDRPIFGACATARPKHDRNHRRFSRRGLEAVRAEVFAIAGAIQPRYRLLVHLATFAQLRFGELVALRRSSIDLDTMELRVRKATAEMQDGSQVDDDPKSRAGNSPISLPAALRADID
jgi:hypothetical protein